MTSTELKSSIIGQLPLLICSLLGGLMIHAFGLSFPVMLLLIALGISMIYAISRDASNGLFLLIIAGFFSVGLTRYVTAPLGLLIDFMLVAVLLIYFIKTFREISWQPLKNPAFLLISGWMILNILELGNPEAHSFEAWFYAMRGVALYFFLTALLGYLLLRSEKHFSTFIIIWFVCSLIGTLWGIKQLYWGLDEAEKAWLDVPGNMTTHMLFGKLRVFSFYSDAGQFGASQAHAAIVAALLSINEKVKSKKYFFYFVAILSFYGMLISGTRGAFAIPVVGFFAYLLLIRKWKVVIMGSIVLIGVFGLLKFTSIGQGTYEIQRLRSSLNPDDPSLRVRLENQRRLKVYLNSHPLGGGIGSAGYWGLRFTPYTFLANLPLDSWYVRIAAEYGYYVFILYVAMLIGIMIIALKRLRQCRDEDHKNRLIAIFGGLSGVLVASYGNQVFGQLPTAILIYLSIVFLTQNENEERA